MVCFGFRYRILQYANNLKSNDFKNRFKTLALRLSHPLISIKRKNINERKDMGRQNETWRNSAYLENIDRHYQGEFIKNRVFVGMAFDISSDISDAFQAIRRSCEKVSLDAFRIDDQVGSGPIPNRILREIEEAEFLVFDLSVERPNVYYELGYAHGVGNRAEDILLIAKLGTNIHFDIAHLNIHFYQSTTELERDLPEKFRKMIKITR